MVEEIVSRQEETYGQDYHQTTGNASGGVKHKVSWARLRRVDSPNLEAGNLPNSSKPTHHCSSSHQQNLMAMFGSVLGRVKLMPRVHGRISWNGLAVFAPFVVLLITTFIFMYMRTEILLINSSISAHNVHNTTTVIQVQVHESPKESSDCNNNNHCSMLSPPLIQIKTKPGPYYNWELFDADYQEMLQKLKIFVYTNVSMNDKSSPFTRIFLPHTNPLDPKIGNYFSEHAFKLALLKSSIVTQRPEEANFFFMPFSINVMRNHPLVHSGESISDFVANYVTRISSEFQFWNSSGGADHFFICCHSVGREATSKHFTLRNNAIQVTCSSSYFQRLYIVHKDISLPQVWPRKENQFLNPPNARDKLAFYAGRVQNSVIRQELLNLWENDTSFSIFPGHAPFPYEEGFKRSKYCLHVKGYEVNTARVSDAIHFGCIPVLISNHYDLPFANILDWKKFSIIVTHGDIAQLKSILMSVNEEMYLSLYENLCTVRKHFSWHDMPTSYDSFYMTVYQLWLKRGLHRLVA